QRTIAPKTKPSVTRARARKLDTGRFDRETTFDGADDLVHLNIHQAHDVEPAAAKVMALADSVARNRDIVCRPRPVARRARRSVNTDDGRPDGRGKVRGS